MLPSLLCTLTLAVTLQAPAPASPPEDKPFQHLLPNLAQDLGHVMSWDSLAILGTGVAGGIVTHQVDTRVSTWAVAAGTSDYTPIGARLGDGWTQGGAALATYGIGLLARDRQTIHIGSDLIRAQILNGLFTRGAKFAIDRQRPGGGADSMPSGHTSASVATATVLFEHFGWKVGVPAFAAAGFVGWTRVRDHQHWLSDVIVGASIGAVVGHAVAGDHRSGTWTFVPVTSPTKLAIYVVR